MAKLGTAQPPPRPQNAGKGKVWGRPFQKGQSGNPGGKKKKTPEVVNVVELAHQATPTAMQTMIDIMKNDKAPFSVRAYCADKVMDRALGKPTQNTNMNVTASQRNIRDLTDAELMQIIDQGTQAANQAKDITPIGSNNQPQPILIAPEPNPAQPTQPSSDQTQPRSDTAQGQIDEEIRGDLRSGPPLAAAQSAAPQPLVEAEAELLPGMAEDDEADAA